MKCWLIVGIIFFSILAKGQDRDRITLNNYLSVYSNTDNLQSNFEEVNHFLAKLEKKQSKYSEKEFLRYLFAKAHFKFLKNYQVNASFSELLKKGTYNCLTATALYGLVLNYFHYEFEMIETNYHIFIMVQLSNSKLLLETTDPLNGFVDNPQEIKNRIATYNRHVLEVKQNDEYLFATEVFKPVTLEQITGLLYYNLAVEAYNNKEILKALELLDNAILKYESSRMKEFSLVVLQALKLFDLDTTAKQSYSKRISGLSENKIEN